MDGICYDCYKEILMAVLESGSKGRPSLWYIYGMFMYMYWISSEILFIPTPLSFIRGESFISIIHSKVVGTNEKVGCGCILGSLFGSTSGVKAEESIIDNSCAHKLS